MFDLLPYFKNNSWSRFDWDEVKGDEGSLGFTLIETIMVVSIGALLFGAGISAYLSFAEKQTVLNKGREFVGVLRDAQKRAQAGEKPADCDIPVSKVLEGWVVRKKNAVDTAYVLEAVCGGSAYARESVVLGEGLVFGSDFNFSFEVLTGMVTGAGLISIQDSDGDYQFTIDVSSGGSVSDQGLVEQ